jgi:hypothetical protein
MILVTLGLKYRVFGAPKFGSNSHFDVTELSAQLHTSVCFPVKGTKRSTYLLYGCVIPRGPSWRWGRRKNIPIKSSL